MGQAQSTGPRQLHNRFLKSVHKVIQQAGRYRSYLRFTHQLCSSKFGSPNNQLGSMERLRSMILSSQEMAMCFASVWFHPIWLLSSFQACCHLFCLRKVRNSHFDTPVQLQRSALLAANFCCYDRKHFFSNDIMDIVVAETHNPILRKIHPALVDFN